MRRRGLVLLAILIHLSGAQLLAQGVGDTAPDFTLKGLDDSLVSLHQFAGHPILIDIWASWCPPCREETPWVVEAWDRYRESGLIVLAINARNVETTGRAMRRFVSEFKMEFPVLLDEKGRVQKLYGLKTLPYMVFIDSNGVIVATEPDPVAEPRFLRDLALIVPPR